ncbi:MAG TPA: HAMP domain-containing protein, partial [Bacilli bacterium]
MSVRRKLFAVIATFILTMGVIFVFLTLVIVKDIILVMVQVDRSKEIGALSAEFAQFYMRNGNSWEGVGQMELGGEWLGRTDARVLLMSTDKKRLYPRQEFQDKYTIFMGIRKDIKVNGKTVAYLYYYDQEVANVAKLKYGVTNSVIVILLFSSVIIILVSLFVAYRLAKRMTAPLQQFIQAIERLGKGELGVQVPLQSKDEYGKVAAAFNNMSTQIKRAEAIRKSLVADVAHELRTPITIIRGKLDLIQQSGGSVEPESLLPLQDELIRLTRLVEDLHLLSLAEARKLPIERKPVAVPALLRRII